VFGYVLIPSVIFHSKVVDNHSINSDFIVVHTICFTGQGVAGFLNKRAMRTMATVHWAIGGEDQKTLARGQCGFLTLVAKRSTILYHERSVISVTILVPGTYT
jgi:hypothetical protein